MHCTSSVPLITTAFSAVLWLSSLPAFAMSEVEGKFLFLAGYCTAAADSIEKLPFEKSGEMQYIHKSAALMAVDIFLKYPNVAEDEYLRNYNAMFPVFSAAADSLPKKESLDLLSSAVDLCFAAFPPS